MRQKRATPSYSLILVIIAYILAEMYPENSTLIYSIFIFIALAVVLILRAMYKETTIK